MTVRCGSIAEVRANIDRLDRDIVRLLAERSTFVTQAAALKSTRAAVVDPARIEEIIAKVRAQAGELATDPDLIERIYRAMIDAFIAFEDGHWVAGHPDP